jgi:hypothetical protein
MYGEKKVETLFGLGVDGIESVYTDSFSDAPLMKVSKKTFLVKCGKIIE